MAVPGAPPQIVPLAQSPAACLRPAVLRQSAKPFLPLPSELPRTTVQPKGQACSPDIVLAPHYHLISQSYPAGRHPIAAEYPSLVEPQQLFPELRSRPLALAPKVIKVTRPVVRVEAQVKHCRSRLASLGLRLPQPP